MNTKPKKSKKEIFKEIQSKGRIESREEFLVMSENLFVTVKTKEQLIQLLVFINDSLMEGAIYLPSSDNDLYFNNIMITNSELKFMVDYDLVYSVLYNDIVEFKTKIVKGIHELSLQIKEIGLVKIGFSLINI